jgi:hypothetical protein
VELIPAYLNQEALGKKEDTPLFRLLIELEKHELCFSSKTILSDLVRNISLPPQSGGEIDEMAQELLPMLRVISYNCSNLVEKLRLLQQGFEQLNKEA